MTAAGKGDPRDDALAPSPRPTPGRSGYVHAGLAVLAYLLAVVCAAAAIVIAQQGHGLFAVVELAFVALPLGLCGDGQRRAALDTPHA